MKRALIASKAKVEGVAQEKFSGAPPQTPSRFAPPIKIPGGATVVNVCHIICSCWGALSHKMPKGPDCLHYANGKNPLMVARNKPIWTRVKMRFEI